MKKVRIAELLIEAVSHLGVNKISSEDLGKQDYDFYKDTMEFLNSKEIKPIWESHKYAKMSYDEMVEFVLNK